MKETFTDSTPKCPHKKIIEIWNQEIKSLAKVLQLTPDREKALKLRWREEPERQYLDWWRKFFRKIQLSDFLCGRTAGKDGRTFTADFDWILNPKFFARILEGKYDNKNGNGKLKKAEVW